MALINRVEIDITKPVPVRILHRCSKSGEMEPYTYLPKKGKEGEEVYGFRCAYCGEELHLNEDGRE